jgi:hypothetical protein
VVCRADSRGHGYVEIGNPELIGKRDNRIVPIEPGGTLSHYVSFYFTPASPMLYNIKTGWNGIRHRPNEEILILVSTLLKLQEAGVPFVFTDRHAYLLAASFYTDLAYLDRLPWDLLQTKNFRRNHEDPSAFERYQAEALVYRRLPVDSLLAIACYNAASAAFVDRLLADHGLRIRTLIRPGWYF